MMYGPIAGQEWGGGEIDTPWLPDGALAYLDFVGGHYWDGAIVGVSAMLGGDFDPDDITASGMAVWFTNANRPNAIGAFAAILTAGLASGFTALIEMSRTDVIDGALISFSDNADFNAAGWTLESYAAEDSFMKMNDGSDLFLTSSGASYSAGVHKLGQTFSRDLGGGSWRYATSVDGAAAETQDITYAGDTNFSTVAKIAIGHIDDYSVAYDSAYFRSITIYPAMDEAALAALTA